MAADSPFTTLTTMAPTWLPPLLPGEQLLWQGRPSQTPIALRPLEAVLIPFSFFWAGFAGVWNLFAWGSAPLSFSLFGLPFLAAGLYFTVGRFAHNWYMRSRTHYALTTQRAFVLQGRLAGVKTLQRFLDPTLQVATNSHRNGSGTIVLGEPPSLFSQRHNVWANTGVDGFQFWKIHDADHVAQIILSCQHAQAHRALGTATTQDYRRGWDPSRG